jgi:hypothetical protein
MDWSVEIAQGTEEATWECVAFFSDEMERFDLVLATADTPEQAKQEALTNIEGATYRIGLIGEDDGADEVDGPIVVVLPNSAQIAVGWAMGERAEAVSMAKEEIASIANLVRQL